MATRIPGMTARKGPVRTPTPGLRPEYIIGSRPENLRAPLPGGKANLNIKPQAAGTRNYGKPIAGPGADTFPKGIGP